MCCASFNRASRIGSYPSVSRETGRASSRSHPSSRPHMISLRRHRSSKNAPKLRQARAGQLPTFFPIALILRSFIKLRASSGLTRSTSTVDGSPVSGVVIERKAHLVVFVEPQIILGEKFAQAFPSASIEHVVKANPIVDLRLRVIDTGSRVLSLGARTASSVRISQQLANPVPPLRSDVRTPYHLSHSHFTQAYPNPSSSNILKFGSRQRPARA